MGIVFKVLDRDDSVQGKKLTLAFPDESGQQLTLAGLAETDLSAFVTGQQYTLAGVPFVAPTDPAAVASPAGATAPVPVDHPAVIQPSDAADAEPATPTTTADSMAAAGLPMPAAGAVAGQAAASASSAGSSSSNAGS
jgi:hypothetical protein